jgi:hypothetical protein
MAEKLACIVCGAPMTLERVTPQLGTLPELRTFRCTACGVVRTTDSKEDIEAASRPNSASKSPKSKSFLPLIIKFGLAFLFGAATVTILMSMR